MAPVTRSQTFPGKQARLCVDLEDPSDLEEQMIHDDSQDSKQQQNNMVADLVEFEYETKYLETKDPELLYTIHNMWVIGLVSTEHVQQFSTKFAKVHAEISEQDTASMPQHLKLHDVKSSWAKTDIRNMLKMIGLGYLTGMKKDHLWELLHPYKRRLQCFPPEAINIIDRYSTYVEKKNTVANMIGSDIPHFITFDMYMYRNVDHHSHSVEVFAQYNNSARCIEAWYLLVSLVRDPYRDVTFTACHKTFGLTLHHLKDIITYRQQPTMDLYAGTEFSSATGTVAYRHHRYTTQKDKPIMRLYKLGDVFKLLIQDHGSWGALMDHLQTSFPLGYVPRKVSIGPITRPANPLK